MVLLTKLAKKPTSSAICLYMIQWSSIISSSTTRSISLVTLHSQCIAEGLVRCIFLRLSPMYKKSKPGFRTCTRRWWVPVLLCQLFVDIRWFLTVLHEQLTWLLYIWFTPFDLTSSDLGWPVTKNKICKMQQAAHCNENLMFSYLRAGLSSGSKIFAVASREVGEAH